MFGFLFGGSKRGARRFDGTLRSFDRKRGYEQWHRYCRSARGRHAPAPSVEEDRRLRETGVLRLPVLSPPQAGRTLERLRARASRIDARSGAHAETFAVSDGAAAAEAFEQVFGGPVDRAIGAWFGSEYLIYWWTLGRAHSGQAAQRSFLWHCDKGPTSHLKLLLYLNPTAEHGGATEFIAKPATRAIGRTGYVFGPVNERRSDIRPLAETAGIAFETISCDMAAGEAVVFEPARVLHRGILPRTGPRWVLTFCLLPSPLPWKTVFTRTGGLVTDDFAWRPHASELAGLIDRPANGES